MATSPTYIETSRPPTDPWSDANALKIVLTDVQRASNHARWHHQRFRDADALYLSVTNKKTWQGTRVPRSSMPVFMAYLEVEAMLPQVIGALFADDPPFGAEPYPGTSMSQARAVVQHLRQQFRDLGHPGHLLTLRELFRRAFKSALIYGNGIIELGWLLAELQRQTYMRVDTPRRRPSFNPLTGQMFMAPTGEYDSQIVPQTQTYPVSKLIASNVSIKQFGIDPHCSSHLIQDAAFTYTRHLLSINEIKDFAKREGFNIPSDAKLFALAGEKRETEGDRDTAQQEQARGINYHPTGDVSSDPAQARVEAICYKQATRYVWILGTNENTAVVIYNRPNDLGIIPQLDVAFTDVPDRFYGLSICDITEADQKLAMAILDARIDELNLMVHRPLVKKRGTMMPGAMQRLHPGVVFEVEDPEHLKWMDTKPVTQDAYIEYEALERRVQRYTGNSDVAAIGAPTAGGNSANRTATGISTQVAATGVRRNYQVENMEDTVFTPFLEICLALNKRYLPLNQRIAFFGQQGQEEIDPIDILNADVRFFMKASQKMRSRNALQSGGLGLILQTYLNPEYVQYLAQMGFKPNVAEIDGLVMDTLNLPDRSLIVQMTPEEMQQLQAQSSPDEIRMQMQRERLEAQARNQESKEEADLLKTLVSKVATPDAAHEMLGLDPPEAIKAKYNPKPKALPSKGGKSGK